MSTTVKWGLITGMVYVIFSLISNVLGLSQGGNTGLGLLVNTVLFGVTFFTIYLGLKEFRDESLGGYLTVGQAVRSGLAVALVAGVIAGAFTIIYMTLIDPGMVDKIMATAEAQMDAQNVPEEQRELSRKITGMFVNPWIFAPFTVAWVAFWGLIKSLIAGQILKKEAPPTVPLA